MAIRPYTSYQKDHYCHYGNQVFTLPVICSANGSILVYKEYVTENTSSIGVLWNICMHGNWIHLFSVLVLWCGFNFDFDIYVTGNKCNQGFHVISPKSIIELTKWQFWSQKGISKARTLFYYMYKDVFLTIPFLGQWQWMKLILDVIKS